jgi:HEAT repeat protein
MTRTAFLLLLLAAPLRADESDDTLARQLVAVVRDPRVPTNQRVEAAKSLSTMGVKATVAAEELQRQLTLLKKAEQEALQEAVVEALGAIGPAARAAVPTLAKATGRTIDIDLAVKAATKQLLTDAASRNVADLARQLKSRDEGTRLRAAKTLGGLETAAAAAVPDLTAALGDSDADVRRAAIAALRRIQPTAKPTKELVNAIAVDLKDADEVVRLATVKALGKLGRDAADAGPLLQPLLADPDRDVRRAAGEAIARISGGGP